MLILAFLSKVNRYVTPPLFSLTLRARYKAPYLALPLFDKLFLPFLQRIISIEAQEEAESSSQSLKKIRLFFSHMETYKASLNKMSGGGGGGQTTISSNNNNNTVRYHILEKYLRKILVPTNTWSDVLLWRENTQFVSWIRREIMRAKYSSTVKEAVRKNQQLHPDKVKQKPPSKRLLQKAFGLQSWSRNHHGFEHELDDVRELARRFNGVVYRKHPFCPDFKVDLDDDNSDLSDLNLEQIVELAGGQVLCTNPFMLYCEELDLYEIYTEEYIDALAAYLLDRSENDVRDKTIILEIGAGNGLLSEFLSKKIDAMTKTTTVSKNEIIRKKVMMSPKVLGTRNRNVFNTKKKPQTKTYTKIPKIIATDDGSWEIKPIGPVQQLDVESALDKYTNTTNDNQSQVIVICGWMPLGVDFTANFRSANVDEYIIIGEVGGATGHFWKTYGQSVMLGEIAPYEKDSYKRFELDKISSLQFSRYDAKNSRSSSTISFRRTALHT